MKKKSIAIFAIISQFLLFLPNLSAAISTPEEIANLNIPEQNAEEINADQGENLIYYRKPMSDKKKKAKAFYEFHVPIEVVQSYYTDLTTIPEEYNPLVTIKGKNYIRFFVPDLPAIVGVFDNMVRAFGKPVKIWAAFLLQGKATYHLFDPNNPNGSAIRIKIERNWAVDNKPTRINDFRAGKASVIVSDIITELEKLNPNPMTSFYREPGAFGLALNDFDATGKSLGSVFFAQSFRVIPKKASDSTHKTMFMPLHGLLNNQKLYEIAIRRAELTKQIPGSTVEGLLHSLSGAEIERYEKKWITEEYLPKLAEISAYYHYQLGIWFEGHTQNISLWLDRISGKILEFYNKDTADAMMDPSRQALREILPAYEEIPWSLTYRNYVDAASSQDNKYPGRHSFSYLSQSIIDMAEPKDLTLKRKYVGIFLTNYLRAAGVSIDELRSDYEEAISHLLRGELADTSYFSRDSDTPYYDLHDYNGALANIIEEVSDILTKRQFEKLKEDNKTFQISKSDQKKIQKIVNNHISSGEIAWAHGYAKEDYEEAQTENNDGSFFTKDFLSYLPVTNGVIFSNKSTGAIYGVAISLEIKDRTYINDLVRAHKQENPKSSSPNFGVEKNSCESIFK